jgi:short-subunit dehydrogenase
MLRKFKFYFLGLIPGILLVFFILNKKGAQCSGYLPNSRVIAESLSKNFQYSQSFKAEMQKNKIDEKYLRDSIMTTGIVDFDKSQAQKKPCPEYLLYSPDESAKYEITFRKCEKEVTFLEFKKLK